MNERIQRNKESLCLKYCLIKTETTVNKLLSKFEIEQFASYKFLHRIHTYAVYYTNKFF